MRRLRRRFGWAAAQACFIRAGVANEVAKAQEQFLTVHGMAVEPVVDKGHGYCLLRNDKKSTGSSPVADRRWFTNAA
jgi:hypothetical protein